jgi:hypothetical protein
MEHASEHKAGHGILEPMHLSHHSITCVSLITPAEHVKLETHLLVQSDGVFAHFDLAALCGCLGCLR